MDTRILKHGVPARLFPVVPESCKEQKTLSILLAAMVSVRPLADRLMAPLGVKVGKRSNIRCFTEVTLTNEIKNLKDRPDGLIVIESGKSSWSALVEAKVGRHSVETDQLQRYVELAKLNNIDAIITVSNDLTPAPDINPTPLERSLPKNISLFHLSWASVFTTAFLLSSAKEDPFENDDEAYIVSEIIRYLEHPNSGMAALDQMNKDWPKIVSDLQAGHPINFKASEVTDMIVIWLQEARDVALLMTRKLKEPVSISTKRAHINDASTWVEFEKKKFASEKSMSFELDIPNAASKICVEADFLRRCVRVSMKLLAPTDRTSNSARLNWLLKQLQKSRREEIIIRCITKGKSQNFGAMADEIEPKSDEIVTLNEIVSFELEMSSDLGAKFNSRKRFIEALEVIVPDFYENIGQHVRAFVPPPPKITAKKQTGEASGTSLNELPSVEPQDTTVVIETSRPDWAQQWQTPVNTIKETVE